MAARALVASSVVSAGVSTSLQKESRHFRKLAAHVSGLTGTRISAPFLKVQTVQKNNFFMAASSSAATFDGKTFHDFSVKDIDGKDVSLSEYKGKVALVVNVASACGLTASNYKELVPLYEKYKDQGFVVLAFPSNQFGGQEPGTNDQIKDFACSRYKATFPLFSKIDVNGSNADPVFKFLKSQKGGPGILGEIKWNFGKFLVDKDGKVVERYAPTTSPAAIEEDIKNLLKA